MTLASESISISHFKKETYEESPKQTMNNMNSIKQISHTSPEADTTHSKHSSFQPELNANLRPQNPNQKISRDSYTSRNNSLIGSPLLVKSPSFSSTQEKQDTVGSSIKRDSSAHSFSNSESRNSVQTSRKSMQKTYSTLRRSRMDKEVLVGTPVKEGHANYMLMYDMLTGIRISVSRCSAKPPRTLEDNDFVAAHKIAFDITGNEMVPTSKYDFKFKDYAPYVFRVIRECFHVDSVDYLASLTGKYVLSELGSPGKSGSFFYFSQDYRFIIKTIHHYEHRFLLSILCDYVEHVKTNPNTLISRILGLHRVKLPGNRKIHFVVMGNVFPPNKDIHEIYDLKGSVAGRLYPEKEAENNPRAVLKDKNWILRDRKLYLGPIKAEIFINQVTSDVQKIMDYSLLIGIHDTVKGNTENIRDQTLSVFEPDHDVIARAASTVKPRTRVSKSNAIRKMLSESDPIALGPSSAKLPELIPEERLHVVFYRDDGGYQGTNELDNPLPIIYYLGIIDIFTKYNSKKRIETFFKSLGTNRKRISAVNPRHYSARFIDFMKNAISRTTNVKEINEKDCIVSERMSE